VSALVDLAVGLALGFSLTIPPGPMNALIAARSVTSLRAGVATGLGAMSADAVLGAVVYLVHAEVDLAPAIRVIDGAGAALLLVLAYRIFRARYGASAPVLSDRRIYSEALLVGISNPLQILWWLTAGLAFAYVGGLVLFIGLFGAIAIWIVVFPLGLRAGARRYPGFPRAVTLVSVALLGGFAVYFALVAVGLVA
jgi:threonine/homoserine/homoserine lactone efflux protein